jgi:dolichol-phosphate mannosyltransferase
MEHNSDTEARLLSVIEASQTQMVPSLELPVASLPTILPFNPLQHEAWSSDPFRLYDETMRPSERVMPTAKQAKSRQSHQQSYRPSGWAFVDRVLAMLDTVTGGQAGWFQRLFSFLCIGGLGAIVNLLCFSIAYSFLMRSTLSFVAYAIAFIFATEISIITNFVLNDRITFRQFHNPGGSWKARCVRFHVTSTGGILITLGTSFSFLLLLHISALLAQAAALIIATAFNFVFHHLFTYRHSHVQTTEGHSHQPVQEQATVEQAEVTDISERDTSKSLRTHALKALIIIPTYNERENLPSLLQQIFSSCPQIDVLIVDDNSPDGTGQLVEEIRQQDKRIYVLHRPGKLGLGTAYIEGFKYALQQGYDATFEMDADFSHDPCYLPDFLNAIEHADLVIGSRYIPGGNTPNWSRSRRMISGSGNVFARLMLGIPVHDCTGGFRCYRRRVLENIDLDSVQSRGYAFQVELTYRTMKQRFNIVEIPITFMDRRLGTSKMSRKIVIEAFTYVLRARFSKQSLAVPVHASIAQQRQIQAPASIDQVVPPTGSPLGRGSQHPATIGVYNSFQQQANFRHTPSASVVTSTGRQDLQTLSPPQEPLYILRLEAGKESGRVYEIHKKLLSIGRSRESDIPLEDSAISRLNASIVHEDDTNFRLIDEGSVNGTKVNGTMLNKYQAHSLREGDKIQLGQTILVFSRRHTEHTI